MKSFAFLKPLEHLLVAHFDVLRESFVRNAAPGLAEELSAAIWRDSIVRYVLVDGNGRLSSSDLHLYENPMIAACAAEAAGGRVGIVLLDRLP